MSPMARRGPNRRPPDEPPPWFNLAMIVVVAVVLAGAVWPLGWAAHVFWRTFLHGWAS